VYLKNVDLETGKRLESKVEALEVGGFKDVTGDLTLAEAAHAEL